MHNPSTPSSREGAKDTIAKLVSEFEKGKSVFKDPRRYDEAKVRAGFIDPFFEALGWLVKEGQRRVGKGREVIVEDRAGRGNRQRPDYGFYIGGELKFYVEAKQPARDIANDVDAAYQLKSYVWSQRAPLGLLTDFEELLTFHGAFKPHRDKPKLGRVDRLCLTCEAYADQSDLLFDVLSRDAVAEGSIEKLLAEALAANVRQRGQLERDLFKARGAKAVDADFLESLTRWREDVAKELARRNTFRDGAELTEAVQRFIDRLVFARVAEDRGIERTHTLARTVERWERDGGKRRLYRYVIELFERLAPQFNGGLYSPHALSDEAEFDDDDGLLALIKSLYFPESAYRFDAMPVEMLGAVYEQFLGSVVRVTEGGHRAKIEQKPEVRHAGGVFYTPRYIVDAIVERTIGPLVEGSTPEKVLALRIVDPACGSGSFLLGAFQFLIDWHLRFYAQAADPAKKHRGACYVDEDGNLRLTLQRKREILTSCLYGVDIDAQAVEVAQMSLYLKLLEDEAEETLALQRSLELFKAAKYLPDLSRNLRCGNSLLETQDLDPLLAWTESDERRINAFDWHADETGFGAIMRPEADGGRSGFDAVIGNPPYIRVQALNEWAPVEVELYKKRYRAAAEGNYDIYVVFIERSLEILREGGRLGFIVPTGWWKATYGAPLRRLVAEARQYAAVFDFADEQVFGDPTTYTCISFFRKAATPHVEYFRMSPDVMRMRRGSDVPPKYCHKIGWDALDGGPWYLGVPASLRSLLDRLRASGPFLGDPAICPRVFQGLKTSLDPVYVLDVIADEGKHVRVRSKALDREVVLEREPLKPIVKGREMKRFAPLAPRKAVLFPYSVVDGEAGLIPPGEFERHHPKTWRYLLDNKKALDARESGRFRGAAWYQFGRSQALDVVSRPKLLTADMADRNAFSIDRDGSFYVLGGAAGGYGLLPARPEYAAPLLALLNSKLLEWLLRPPGFSAPFRGGWYSCEARFINLLPIRLPASRPDLDGLGALALRAADLYARLATARSDRDKALLARQIEAVESELDDRVYRLYEVTPDERRAIDDSIAESRSGVGADVERPDQETGE
ncbi:MAG: N-6 DNA methylase [Myxococcota bacterium]